MKRTFAGAVAGVLMLAACSGKSTAREDAKGAAEAGASEAKVEAAADAKAGPAAEAAADAKATDDDLPKKAPPLTQEEKDLIAADPATLTPELRRKRAFALRKKIMQNPDSPTARMLEDLRKAAERGELDIPGKTTPRLHANTKDGKQGGPPPAGSRPEQKSGLQK